MAKVALGSGFENLGGGGYRQDVSIATGPTELAQSARLPVGPSGKLPPLTVIPTSTQRPKPSNAAIPYTRTCAEMIPVGEIVLAEGRPEQVTLGNGSKNRSTNLVEVKTIREVNQMIKQESGPITQTDYYPSRLLDGSVDTTAPGFYWTPPPSVAKWVPDGVVISSEEGDVGSSARTGTVAVGGGPTPLLNLPETQTFKKKYDRVGMKVFVAVEYHVGRSEQKYEFKVITKGMIAAGHDVSNIGVIWPIGRLADLNLNTRGRPGGAIAVSIGPGIRDTPQYTRNVYEVMSGTGTRIRKNDILPRKEIPAQLNAM